MRICPRCKENKQLSEFYVRRNYRWISEKYQSHCKTCTLKRRKEWYENGGREKSLKKANDWRKNHPEEAKKRHQLWNWNSKIKAINAYGGVCVCCGESEPKFLAIDHMNNDGAEHRKTLTNQTIYVWLRKNNYPKGFRVLCHNCNMAIAYWKLCPHKI